LGRNRGRGERKRGEERSVRKLNDDETVWLPTLIEGRTLQGKGGAPRLLERQQ